MRQDVFPDSDREYMTEFQAAPWLRETKFQVRLIGGLPLDEPTILSRTGFMPH
jgi:hypothetical protein